RRLAHRDLGSARRPVRGRAGCRRRGAGRRGVGAGAARPSAGRGGGLRHGGADAKFTALAAGRDALLRRSGWDVGRGLTGAPEIGVIVGEEVHATVPAALRMLGLASDTAT